MEQFLSLILSFPTVPLTVAMGVVLLYWLFVILGVASHDMLDGAAGGVKAAGEAASGAVKALGAAKAAGADHGGHDGDADSGGLFTVLGLGKIPITITFSSMVFFAWLGSLILRGVFAGTGALGGSAVLLGCLLASLLVSSVVLRPFAKVFEPARAASRKDIIGHICTISSGKVNGTFGTATISDGGAGLLLNVVCGRDNKLTEGDRAVIIQWDEGNSAFEVEPVDWLSAGEMEALKDPAQARSVIDSRVKAR
jgi:hypothetical protein